MTGVGSPLALVFIMCPLHRSDMWKRAFFGLSKVIVAGTLAIVAECPILSLQQIADAVLVVAVRVVFSFFIVHRIFCNLLFWLSFAFSIINFSHLYCDWHLVELKAA